MAKGSLERISDTKAVDTAIKDAVKKGFLGPQQVFTRPDDIGSPVHIPAMMGEPSSSEPKTWREELRKTGDLEVVLHESRREMSLSIHSTGGKFDGGIVGLGWAKSSEGLVTGQDLIPKLYFVTLRGSSGGLDLGESLTRHYKVGINPPVRAYSAAELAEIDQEVLADSLYNSVLRSHYNREAWMLVANEVGGLLPRVARQALLDGLNSPTK